MDVARNTLDSFACKTVIIILFFHVNPVYKKKLFKQTKANVFFNYTIVKKDGL